MAINFNQYATEENPILKEYTKKMNLGKDTDKAGRIFTAIMHALRDIIPPEESLQFIAQLPMFWKAVYVAPIIYPDHGGNGYGIKTFF